MKLWPGAPSRGQETSGLRSRFGSRHPLLVALAVCLMATASTAAYAQRRPKPAAEGAKDGAAKDSAAKDSAAKDSAGKDGAGKDGGASKEPAKGGKPKVFDFTGIDLAGRLHTPQLLYFLERANEELERAFLERRSFIPHMVRSLEEEAL